MGRICWQSQDEKKPRENKRGQSSNLVNATRSPSLSLSSQQSAHCKFGLIAQFSLQSLTFISSPKVSTADTALQHSIFSSSSFRSTQLNNWITQLLTLDHTHAWGNDTVFFLSFPPRITCKFLKVDMRLILWTNLDQLQHFIPVNSQQHPINCIRKLPSFWPCISGADPFSFPEKELRIQMLILNKRIDSDI